MDIMIYFVLNKYSGSYTFTLEEDILFYAKKKLKDPFKITYTFLSNETNSYLPDIKEDLNPNDIICAVGGDGTVNICLKFLIHKKYTQKVLLAIIPLGTGNNMLHTLKLSKKIEKAIDIISKKKSITLQYGMINNRYPFFNCSIGFSANLLTNRKFKSRNGYFLDILRNISYNPQFIRVTDENKKSIPIKSFNGYFINTTYYASIIPFLKQNKTNDKITFFNIPSKKNIFKFLALIFKINSLDKIESSHFTIQANHDILLEIDGDILPLKSKYEIKYTGKVKLISNK